MCFAIQTDLAQKDTFAIMNTKEKDCHPAEKAQIERRPTQNGEAYLTLCGPICFRVQTDFARHRGPSNFFDRQQDRSGVAREMLCREWHGSMTGCITPSIRTPARKEKREREWKRCLCSQLPEHIRNGFIITMASVIIRTH